MPRSSFARHLAVAVALPSLLAACATAPRDTASASRTPGGVVTDTARGTLAANEPLVELDVGATHAMGIYLSEVSGRALYALSGADPASPVVCAGECLTQFEPVLGRAILGGAEKGVIASMVGTTTRADGTTQLTYNGRPLYRFRGDAWLSDTKGHGRKVDGATAYLVHPNGDVLR